MPLIFFLSKVGRDSIMNMYGMSKEEMFLQEIRAAKQLLAGDKDAFHYFVQMYHVSLFNYIYRFLLDRELTYDVLQTVFFRFYIALPHLDMEKSFKPWLFHVAHHCCIDELRNRSRHKTHTFSSLLLREKLNGSQNIFDLADPHSCIEDMCEFHDLLAILKKIMRELPEKTRNIVILRTTSDMTFSQIGQFLNIPEPTAKVYFGRARKTLRHALIEEGILSIRE